MNFHVEPSVVHKAIVAVPGDKSISHRALMLGSLAEGTTNVGGFLAGEDCLATLTAIRKMGVDIVQHDETTLSIRGVGLRGLTAPTAALDLGNSGTAMRLLTGVLCGQTFDATLTGDESLNTRPMRRVIAPLEKMGAKITSQDGNPPLSIHGGQRLKAIEYELPIASAQVKSCLLLAGLYAEGRTVVREPAATRDHTERMLAAMGVSVESSAGHISIDGGQILQATGIQVPADLSSAAFVMLAAILADDADVLIKNVGVNPTRTGVIDILIALGANITLENRRTLGHEPVADIHVRSADLRGGPVDPALVSLAIDEFPVLFVAAAAAKGTTTFTGIGELRVKESDRIAAMSSGLSALGIAVEESDDGAIIHGGSISGGSVESFADHRIAMSLAVAGSVATGPVTVRDVDSVDTSFPGFLEIMVSLGIMISTERGT